MLGSFTPTACVGVDVNRHESDPVDTATSIRIVEGSLQCERVCVGGGRHRDDTEIQRFLGPALTHLENWSWMKLALGLTDSTGESAAKNCCYTCFANCTSHPFTDLYESALWRLTCLTHTEQLNHCFEHGSQVSASFQILGIDFAYISADLIQCLDLGVVQYLCGCALYDLFLELTGSDEVCEVLRHLLVLIKQTGKALAFSKLAVKKNSA